MHHHTLRRHMSAEMPTRWLCMVSSCVVVVVVVDFVGRYFAFWVVALSGKNSFRALQQEKPEIHKTTFPLYHHPLETVDALLQG